MTKLTEARDIIAGILNHRRGLVLTDAVIRDAAANAATALIPLLDDRYSVVRGEVETRDPITGETPDELARRLIK